MEAACIERNRFSRAKPCGIIHARRRCTVRHYRPWFHPALVTPNLYGADITQLPALHKINSILKMLLAALPLTSLYHPVITLLGRHHSCTFADGIAYWFFHINIFAHFAGVDHDERVPMVGRTYYDGINIFLIQ